MTRTLKAIGIGGFVALSLTSVACEDKDTQQALKSCRDDVSNHQKQEASQLATISDLKSQLAKAQAKVDELTKESEEKGKASEVKKAEASKEGNKAEKKAKKESRK